MSPPLSSPVCLPPIVIPVQLFSSSYTTYQPTCEDPDRLKDRHCRETQTEGTESWAEDRQEEGTAGPQVVGRGDRRGEELVGH